jgi:hypothetical protein
MTNTTTETSAGQNEYAHHNTFYTLSKQVYSNEEYADAVRGFKAGRAALSPSAKAELKRRAGR